MGKIQIEVKIDDMLFMGNISEPGRFSFVIKTFTDNELMFFENWITITQNSIFCYQYKKLVKVRAIDFDITFYEVFVSGRNSLNEFTLTADYSELNLR